MEEIGKSFMIKDGKYGPPDTYLGANIEKVQLDDGSYALRMHSKHYVANLIQTVEDLLQEDWRELKGRWKSKTHTTLLPTSNKPELDNSKLPDHASRYRQLIGMLKWAVELGQMDIHVEVAMMSQYQAEPREGHLEALYLIVHYLKR